MTFEELVAKSIQHAEEAEAGFPRIQAVMDDPDLDGNSVARVEAVMIVQNTTNIHATLAEAYARLASAVIVNRTSLNATLESLGRHRRPD